MSVRVDFALVQPVVYSIRTWLALRRKLPNLLQEGAPARFGLRGTLHLVGDLAPLFDGSLENATTLSEAFPRLLGQAREFPCLVLPMDEPSTHLLSDKGAWPTGFSIDDAETLVIIPGSGDVVVVHLLSGSLNAAARVDVSKGLQLEIRSQLLAALEEEGDTICWKLDNIMESILGKPSTERAAQALAPAGGHLVTLAHGADPEVVTALERVHRIQEGDAENHRELLFPSQPGEACFAHFGWAYTTVATPQRGLRYRLLFPLIAVNQAWYRYDHLRRDLIELSRATHALETDRDLIAQTEFYNAAVLDVIVWEAEREAIERGLRPVFRSVYRKLWNYWDTGESRDTVQKSIDQLRDFLDRKYSVKTAIRESTQARILFVIAIFQLLSVFGLVSGYLYFWEKTRLPESLIFESEVVVWMTLLSPIVVLVAIAWLLVSFFRRHR